MNVFAGLVIALQFTALILCQSASADGSEEETIELEFQDNVFSAYIEDAPLPAVVEKIEAEQDIWVKGINRLPSREYSVEFEDMPLCDGLERILSPANHCLVFDEDGDLEGIVILTSPGTYAKKPKPKKKTYKSRNVRKDTRTKRKNPSYRHRWR